MQLLSKIMGSKKVYEMTTLSREISENFNSIMANTFLINLNELSKKESFQSEGQIKVLITDSSLTVNSKGIDSFEIESFHRFLITTNVEDPITSKKDDKRNLIIRSSDEKIGDKKYFTNLFDLLEDKNVLKKFFECLINLPDLDIFHKLPKPMSDYQNEIQENSIDIIERFIISIVEDNLD